MRAREILIALAAGAGACFVLLDVLAGGGPTRARPAATAADPDPLPGPAAPSVPQAVLPPAAGGLPPVDRESPPPPLHRRFRPTPPPLHGPGTPARPLQPMDPAPLLRALGREGRYGPFLAILRSLPGLPRPGEEAAGSPPAVRRPPPPSPAAALFQALEGASDPVARQNLIFQMAIALPPGEAFPRLRSLAAGGSPGDAADALEALAFRGDPRAAADFVALAEASPPLDLRLLCDGPREQDALAAAGERDRLRSWRCIEALTGRPYFRDQAFPSQVPLPPEEETALARRLLPSWIRRYEGHPGSDDAAYRLARLALAAGEEVEAARWASRAASLPDQDLTRGAVRLLTALAEFGPLEGGVLSRLPDPAEPGLSRGLLAYIRLRRTAAERGFEAAVLEAERLSWTDPDLPVARAWRARGAEPPPRGLDSGIEPLPADDPLRRLEGERIEESGLVNPALEDFVRRDWPRVPPEPEGTPGNREAARDALRLRPPEEVVVLPTRRLAFQMRCWSAIAALERRAAGERDPGARADLLYKAAAILYHQREVLLPAYAAWEYRTGLPDAGVIEESLPPATARAWAGAHDTAGRAAAAFEAIATSHAGTPVAPLAAYSAARAHVRASEDRPPGGPTLLTEDARRGHLRSAVEAFERFAVEHPSHPLAGTAGDQARFWREARPRLRE